MKEIIGIIAIVLTFIAYIPYYRDILKGKSRPHIYSWSLWALLTILLVALQIKGGAGVAAWITASVGVLCLGVVILSFKNGSKDITRSDTVVAILSLVAMGVWLIADQPAVAITLAVLADMLDFIPTVRKSYLDPYSETLSLYATNAVRFCLALLAVEKYTYLSTVWIIAWIIGNGSISILIFVRRKSITQSTV